MNDNYLLLEVIHQNRCTEHKTGITINLKNYQFLKDLYDQYGDFTITKVNDELKLATK